ncbi:AraC family transcriptional regulator [Vibrio penaeicida]|uniref:AraC family transcriptional regulator n=1 Tax=Vibrio penaeicida TaxID=104609 RepID=UPI000CEA26DF|nr:AraC family transcriptional regulator [Vibrio penaeicida]
MKRASKFVVSPSWKVLVTDMGIDVATVLAYSGLPADLFSRPNATLTPLEYFQLWEGLAKAAGERAFPLLIAKYLSVEAFDPPLFASICSPNLNTALKRIQQYKPLIGPMILDLDFSKSHTTLNISCYGHVGALPESLALTEVVFFTQLTRLATRERVQPTKVILPKLPPSVQEYEEYFGCKLAQGEQVQVQFSAEDGLKPFITSNAAMWAFFESSLNQKLIDLDSTATTAERVKAVLMESLPAGNSAIETVAEKLAMSKRTLQRKLTAEAESYQSVLQSVRAELADHYLEKSQMSLGEISFLLGFQEANSFIRAFTTWKGVSPGSYREQYH